jgi:hypothetical protein
MLGSGAVVQFEQTAAGVTLTLPVGDTDVPDRVIVLATVKARHD